MDTKNDFKARFGRWCVKHINNDVLFMKMKGYYRMGYWMNLKHPKTFQEKLNWLKLHDHKEIYHQMVDKYDAKLFIDNRIGKGYTIPTIGCWNSFDEIDFNALPDQFIIKNTFDSGSYSICMDKSKFDWVSARKKLLQAWSMDYYKESREWPYKGLQRRIIIEPLIASPKDLKEFKFFCFNGEPRIFQTCYDRDNSRGGAELNFYNLAGEKLNISDLGHTRETTYEFGASPNLSKMIDLCHKLASETYVLRVDFYETPDNIIYCGEMTFFEGGGFGKFTPDEWNYRLGEWIKLPIDK